MFKLYEFGEKYKLLATANDLDEIILDLSYVYYQTEDVMYLITERKEDFDDVFRFIRTEEDYLQLIQDYNNGLLRKRGR